MFVLDFMNDADTIQDAFSDYYRTTLLAEETDPDKLHDLKATLDALPGLLARRQVDVLVDLLPRRRRPRPARPDPRRLRRVYREQLDEDGQVEFKGQAKAFLRTYGFLSSILPYTKAEWEKLSIFLTFLVPKLPAPIEDDLSKGILEAIDMDSYRVEKQAVIQIQLPDEDAEIEPVPTTVGGHKPEPELDRLSQHPQDLQRPVREHRLDRRGSSPQADHRGHPASVAADAAYQNARKNSDKQNARIEHDKALARVMNGVLKDDTELFKLFMDNDWFRRWMTEKVFHLTYESETAA